MSEKRYSTVAGIIQFPVGEPRDANGKAVRDITIRAIGTGGQLVRISLWDQFEDAKVEKGDFIVADGEAKKNQGSDGKTYNNLNAYVLHVNYKKITPKDTERSVSNSSSSSDDDGADDLF